MMQRDFPGQLPHRTEVQGEIDAQVPRLMAMPRFRVLRYAQIVALAALSLAARTEGWPQSRDNPPQDGASRKISPEARFRHGQSALQDGDLAGAEKDFQAVLAADPLSSAAYANLGVIAMRRMQWERALNYLHHAQKLDPQQPGIRLNIALVEYRRGNYSAAVAPLESVLADQPSSQQARYLLGLSDIFSNRYAQAVEALSPLWPQMSGDVMYLYVLDIAAHSAGQKDLDEKVLARLVEVGSDTPQFHLILGKAYLYRRETDKAIAELQLADQGDTNLPYLHFNLGLAYSRANEDDKAEAEFKRDIAVEPDIADNYEQLGALYLRRGRDQEAEKLFHEALQRDATRVLSLTSLSKIYLKQGKEKLALSSVDQAVKSDPQSQSAHFLRGQVLMRLGQRQQAQAEFAAAQKILDSGLDHDREVYGDPTSDNPELVKQPI